jgi:tetratricopeptide (TPR) repeat protein
MYYSIGNFSLSPVTTLRVVGLVAAFGLLANCGRDGGQTQTIPPEPATPQMLACADALAPMIPNLGDFSRPVNTAYPEAQAYFDQGLRLVYSYYFPEAIASFEAAQCFDPNHAMLEWGKALAIGPNPNSRYGASPDDPAGAGKEAIASAMANRGGLPAGDQGLIEALVPLFDTDTYPDTMSRTLAFVDAAEANYQRFPTDMEATFLVPHGIMMTTPWNYYSQRDGAPMPGVERALAVLETGMAQMPEHPGLTHLHIHLLEASFEPERAETSADRLESLTPMAGHMVHMPGHIYMRVGRYEDSIATNQRSLQADDVVVQAWGDRPLPRTGTYFLSATNHGGHARMFIHWAGILQGNAERALGISAPMAMMANADNLARGGGLRTPVVHWMTLKAFGRFDELLALENLALEQPYLQGMLHYMHGSAYANKGNFEAALAEYRAMQVVRQNPVLETQRASVNVASDMLAVASHALAGEIASSRGDYAAAIDQFSQAVALQDALRYMEPPDWLQSMRLFLGQAHLNAGQFAQAQNIFERDLVLLQENGWALYGLTEALEKQSRSAEADQVRHRFIRAWQNADVILSAAHF